MGHCSMPASWGLTMRDTVVGKGWKSEEESESGRNPFPTGFLYVRLQ
jgi:hypothetical protein